MRRALKRIMQWMLRATVSTMTQTAGGRYAYQQLLQAGLHMHNTIYHGATSIVLSTPNALCQYRAKSFSTKEPETLSWLDAIPEGSVFWDVGANVGLYSIYAAKKNRVTVFAFEPSVFNLEFLARNIFLNDLQVHKIKLL